MVSCRNSSGKTGQRYKWRWLLLLFYGRGEDFDVGYVCVVHSVASAVHSQQGEGMMVPRLFQRAYWEKALNSPNLFK